MNLWLLQKYIKENKILTETTKTFWQGTIQEKLWILSVFSKTVIFSFLKNSFWYLRYTLMLIFRRYFPLTASIPIASTMNNMENIKIILDSIYTNIYSLGQTLGTVIIVMLIIALIKSLKWLWYILSTSYQWLFKYEDLMVYKPDLIKKTEKIWDEKMNAKILKLKMKEDKLKDKIGILKTNRVEKKKKCLIP